MTVILAILLEFIRVICHKHFNMLTRFPLWSYTYCAIPCLQNGQTVGEQLTTCGGRVPVLLLQLDYRIIDRSMWMPVLCMIFPPRK